MTAGHETVPQSIPSTVQRWGASSQLTLSR